MLQQYFYFAAKNKSSAWCCKVQRLNADAIARAEQLLFVLIPDSDREHTKEPFKAGFTPFLIGIKNGFGVRLRAVAVTLGHQFSPNLLMVIDLAIENERISTIECGHGL